MKDTLHLVLDVFPDSSELIRQLYDKDDDFRSLCQDHADTLKAIENWRQSDKSEAPKRVIEYQSLVGELQEDIKQWLEKVKKKHASSGVD